MNKKSGIYQIRNLVDEKRYIGQSIDLHKRKLSHFSILDLNKHDNFHLQNSYNKYRKENFVFEILLYCEPFQLTDYEQFFVDQYKNSELLYNARLECVNSNKGMHHSEKSKRQMSLALKGRCFSDEHRRRLSIANSGENHYLWGKHQPEKIKKKISLALSGENNFWFGKHILNETRIKIMETRGTTKEKILIIKGMLSENIEKANIAKSVGVSESTVYKVKNGGYDEVYNLPSTIYNKKYSRSKEAIKRMMIGRKIDLETVLSIKRLLNQKVKVVVITEKMNVGKSTVYRVKIGDYDKIFDL